MEPLQKVNDNMKKHYTFSTGETIEADLDDLRRLLAENQQYLDNYEEVYSSLEDDDYIARGNGFCDRKYSDDFVEGQMEKYAQRVKEIEGWIEIDERMGAHHALKLLKEGNARFVSGQLAPKDHYAEDRLKLSEGQHPFAVVLCCSDSRVAPEILFDQQLGDVFVIRNAGNVVDEDVLGSIEYAVEHLGSPLVVVLGHSSCGAVTAACQGGELPGHLVDIAKRIKPSIETNCCIDDNAKRHARKMAQLIEEDEIVHHVGAKVVAAFYDLQSGKVEWL